MGLLLSRSHFHGENNSPQSVFYTDCKNNLAHAGTLIWDTTCYFKQAMALGKQIVKAACPKSNLKFNLF